MRQESEIRILETQISNINTNHALHLIVSFFLIGIWVPMWIMIAISNASVKNKKTKRLNDLYDQLDRMGHG